MTRCLTITHTRALILKSCIPIVGSCGLLTAADLVAELTVDERPRILPNAEPISTALDLDDLYLVCVLKMLINPNGTIFFFFFLGVLPVFRR